MCFWDWPEGGHPDIQLHSAVAEGVGEHNAPRIFTALAGAPRGWLGGIIESASSLGLCALTSEVDPGGQLSYRDELRDEGVHEGLNLLACDLDRRGFLVSVAVPAGYELASALRANLGRALTHVLAGHRLRRRIGATEPARLSNGEASEKPDAVLSPGGDVLDAHGAAGLPGARRELVAAVRNIERARAGKFDTQDGALKAWKGLVSARWSLVDTFERGGDRYVLARENRPCAAVLAGLTPTECDVVAYAARGLSTKETAYALGISATTVRVLLMRAARRCGVKNRRQLLELWNRQTRPGSFMP